MTLLSRRAFTAGAAAVAAARLPPATAQGFVQVRRAFDAGAPLDSYRRAVAMLMAREPADPTGWQFQANMVGAAAAEIAGSPLARYWRQAPRKTFFFLAWQRMHLYHFERILRRASGDPVFALPYWSFVRTDQRLLPEPFRPAPEEFDRPPAARSNALARAVRMPAFERGDAPAADVAAAVDAALALPRFAAADPLDPRGGFAGVAVADPARAVAPGAIETIAARLLDSAGGDLGSPVSAARDPLYWLVAANLDRLWVNWAARHARAPTDAAAFMTTSFTFFDENGEARRMTGADVLDTQFQLGYRYDDDLLRSERLSLTAETPVSPPDPIVLAQAVEIDLAARETAVPLLPAPPVRQQPQKGRAAKAPAGPPRTRLVLRDVLMPAGSPVFELALVLEGGNVFEPTTTREPAGVLKLPGGSGRFGDERETVVFDVSEALARLGKVRGYNLRHLRLTFSRRAAAAGAAAPEIGAVELVRSQASPSPP